MGTPKDPEKYKEYIEKLRKTHKGKSTWNKGLPKEQQPWWGKKHKEDSKNKIRLANLGKKQHQCTIERRVKKLKGQKRTEETKRKISLAQQGKIRTKEAKEKMSLAKKGKISPRKGVVLSDETKRKIGLSLKGKQLGENNPAYIDGRCANNFWYQLKKMEKYKKWIIAIFAKDNNTCQKCGQKGGKLTAHHITALSFLLTTYLVKTIEDATKCKELWDINNGKLLCHRCHKLTCNYGGKAIKNPIDNTKY